MTLFSVYCHLRASFFHEGRPAATSSLDPSAGITAAGFTAAGFTAVNNPY